MEERRKGRGGGGETQLAWRGGEQDPQTTSPGMDQSQKMETHLPSNLFISSLSWCILDCMPGWAKV